MVALLLLLATVGWLLVEYLVRPGEASSADRITVVRPWRTYRLDPASARDADGRFDLREVPPEEIGWHLLSITVVLATAHAAVMARVMGW